MGAPQAGKVLASRVVVRTTRSCIPGIIQVD